MKGIVMDISDQHIVVLCEDGNYRNVKHHGSFPQLGDRVYVPIDSLIKKNKTFPLIQKYSLLVASFIGIMLFAIGFLSSDKTLIQPAFMVALDINPSLEFYVKPDGKVQKVVLINDDAKEILLENDYKDMDFYDAINEAIIYIDKNIGAEDNRWIWMSVLNLNNGNTQIDESKLKLGVGHKLQIYYVNSVQKETANRMGLSLNKYMVYEQAKEKGIHLDVEHLRNHSIPDTMKNARVTVKDFFPIMDDKKQKIPENELEANKVVELEQAPNENDRSKNDIKTPSRKYEENNEEDENYGESENEENENNEDEDGGEDEYDEDKENDD